MIMPTRASGVGNTFAKVSISVSSPGYGYPLLDLGTKICHPDGM
jgi:hypothetical protein